MKRFLKRILEQFTPAPPTGKEYHGHDLNKRGICKRCGCSETFIRHTWCRCHQDQPKQKIRNLVVGLGVCDALLSDGDIAVGLSMYGMNDLPSVVFKSSGLEAAYAIEEGIAFKLLMVEDSRACLVHSNYKEDDRPALPMMRELQKQILRWRAEGGFPVASGETLWGERI